ALVRLAPRRVCGRRALLPDPPGDGYALLSRPIAFVAAHHLSRDLHPVSNRTGDRPGPGPGANRETLLEFFDDHSRRPDGYLVHDDGYRTRETTYQATAALARAFAARLARDGVGREDKVVSWAENRIEWIAALWGCLLRGAVVVPVDYRASPDLVRRISAIVRASLVLVGDEVELPEGVTGRVERLSQAIETGEPATGAAPVAPSPSTLAEII